MSRIYLIIGDYECSGLGADSGLIYTWPYELAGDLVDLNDEQIQGRILASLL
ncbi:hypothetical protein [Butyrivibrio sp. LC3010]|uniref:hypothetical protein n=1 Tax=Butyrivibrio sp. LC3010 TaxID=1280680 RepID=UPI000419EA06|nr:hypothetical protein [Butyrivibrio sp. LC3010]